MRFLSRLLAVAFTLASGLLAGLVWLRLKLPYNSEERFFDRESGMMYHEQAVTAYSTMLVISLMLSVLFVYFGFKSKKELQKTDSALY
jgi:hypothetical protein